MVKKSLAAGRTQCGPWGLVDARRCGVLNGDDGDRLLRVVICDTAVARFESQLAAVAAATEAPADAAAVARLLLDNGGGGGGGGSGRVTRAEFVAMARRGVRGGSKCTSDGGAVAGAPVAKAAEDTTACVGAAAVRRAVHRRQRQSQRRPGQYTAHPPPVSLDVGARRRGGATSSRGTRQPAVARPTNAALWTWPLASVGSWFRLIAATVAGFRILCEVRRCPRAMHRPAKGGACGITR